MYTTTSFSYNIVRDSVDEFNARFKGFGAVEAFPTHTDGFEAKGIARSEDRGAVEQVERIAFRREQELTQRFTRQNYLQLALAAGEITEDEFDREYSLSF